MNTINSDWFSISNDDDKEIKENIEKSLKYDQLLEKNKDLENKVKELENKLKELENKTIDLDLTCNKIRNENLKIINRVLEAEISIERTKNILLRKNISFPFTPLTTKFL